MADFADPRQNVAKLQLKDGMHVADFGCGSGFYALAAAHRVGSRGHVYAVDVQKDLLEKLQEQAHRDHVANLDVVWGDLDEVGGTKLADQLVDAVIISNVLFQAENKNALAAEAFRVMMVGGTVLVIDWADSFSNLGPKPEHVVPEDTAKLYFTEAGFTFTESFSAGEHHYGLLLKKP